jgi:hypothetical protein
MIDTPLTDAALVLCVRDEEIQGEQMRMKMHPLYDHACRLERDRARLFEALWWYARASNCELREDAGFMAWTAIADVEREDEKWPMHLNF